MAEDTKKATSTYSRAGISPKKVVSVAKVVRGMKVPDAERFLKFNNEKASGIILQVLKSAAANAENNLKLKSSNMYVEKLMLGPGPVLKRGRYAGRGNFQPLRKRMSNISIVLSEQESEEGSKKNE